MIGNLIYGLRGIRLDMLIQDYWPLSPFLRFLTGATDHAAMLATRHPVQMAEREIYSYAADLRRAYKCDAPVTHHAALWWERVGSFSRAST